MHRSHPVDPPAVGNLHDYYACRARRIVERDNQPNALPDAEAWRELRPALHRQLMRSLGLENMPERCDLRPTVTGTFAGPGYTVKKLAYQLLPDCWGSAHLYRPADVPDDQPTPAVLYTCGHKFAGVIGYQHHAIAWARRGYTCLIFDTLEQHDNPGDHHGLFLGRTPEWIAMGYTPAGGEIFNGIRALDLLLAQPGVDADRVGVTGISGGGAQSFLLAAVDDRLRAVATVCGVSDPAYAIPNGHVSAHCDCMYIYNIFARDVTAYAALIAPRALLYCFARHDGLYTPAEFRDLHQRTQTRFEKFGCGEQVALHEFDGPHGYNHRDTTDAIHQWFDKHVAGETRPNVDTLAIEHNDELADETTASVFHGHPPEPNRLDLLPQLLLRRGRVPRPEQRAEWPAVRQAAVERLRDEVFHLLDDVEQAQQVQHYGEWAMHNDTHRLAWHGRLDGMAQSLLHIKPVDDNHEAVLVGVGERGETAASLVGGLSEPSAANRVAPVAIEPRACGYAAFDERHRNLLNRTGCLVGMTPTMLMVQDLHHLWPHIKAMASVAGRPIYLYGRGEGALAILYHALLHDDADVAGVILEDLPTDYAHTSHQVMGVLRVMDIAQAIGLLAPTPVTMIGVRQWFSLYFGMAAHRCFGETALQAAGSLASALTQYRHLAAKADV